MIVHGVDQSIQEFTRCINRFVVGMVNIEKVIYNNPATIVVWSDGVKTVVKCHNGDTYDKKTGLLLCIAKRMFGNTGYFNNVLDKWCPERQADNCSYETKQSEQQYSDSQEKINADAELRCTDYWGCIALTCDHCPALKEGKRPYERIGGISFHDCLKAQTLDLLRRQRELCSRESTK